MQTSMVAPLTSLPLTLTTPMVAPRPERSFGDMLSAALGHVNSSYHKQQAGADRLVTGLPEETHTGAIKTERSGVLLHLTVQAASKLTGCITQILQIPL
ncbi:MAG: flagellar hook-basal body complex protein FliE [Candidatus Xenobia bacterium]